MKKAVKKICAIMLVVAMSVMMAGCGNKCKEKGCNEEVFKKGYCQEHYLEHEIRDLLGF